MKINLKDAFWLDQYEKTLSFNLKTQEFEELETVAGFPSEPVVRFDIKAKYGLVHCTTVIDFEYESFCCRCLEPVRGTLRVENCRRMITDPTKESEDTVLIDEGYTFYPEEEAKNQIILEFPERFLCSEDCKGLCPECGCNLNMESCSCEPRDVD